MSTIKVDTIATRTGSGNITLSNNVASLTSSGAIAGTTITATSSGAPLTVNSTNSNNNKIIFQNNGSAVSHLGGISNGLIFSNAAGAQIGRLDADGLKFGTDTAAVNALDDYEEGTFTPAFTQGINAGASYTAQSGRYTKIGRQVITEVDLDLNSFSANGSHIFVGGFPFVSNSAAPYGGGFFNYNGGWYNSLGQWLMIANAQYAAFYRQSDGGAMGGTTSGISMGGTCRFVLLYMTA